MPKHTYFLPRIYLSAFIFQLWLIGGCEPSCKGTGETTDVLHKENASLKNDEVVAIVNGINLKKSELDKSHNRSSTKFNQANRPLNADMDRKLRGSILRKMIDDELLRQKSAEEDIKVDRFERVANYEKYQEKMGGKKVFNNFLEREKYSEEEIQKIILADLQKEKLIEKLSHIDAPTDEEITRHYENNKRLYALPEMVHARHILLKLDPKEPEEKAQEVLKKANQILHEAQKPNASFTDLVKKYSEGPSLKQGGDLGFFPRGRMVKAFEDMAFNAPLKKAVGPVRTDFGYHIIFIEEKLAPRTAPIEEVRPRIVEFLSASKQSIKKAEIIEKLRKSAKIKIYDYSMTNEEYFELSSREQLAESSTKPKAN